MAAIPTTKRIDADSLNLKEQVVSINRVTKVVKGGKNLSFSALVVVGDPGARIVGFGTGKAKEVPAAIKKGIEAAKKNLRKVNVLETTILHAVLGRFGSGLVLLKPAPEGTGVIAGGPVRAVIQAVGIPNVLDEIHRLAQSAQRGESHHQRAGAIARQGAGGGDARFESREGNVRFLNMADSNDQNQIDWQPDLLPGEAQGDRAVAGVEDHESNRSCGRIRRCFAAWSPRFRICWLSLRTSQGMTKD